MRLYLSLQPDGSERYVEVIPSKPPCSIRDKMAVQSFKVTMVGRMYERLVKRNQEDTFQDDGKITPEL